MRNSKLLSLSITGQTKIVTVYDWDNHDFVSALVTTAIKKALAESDLTVKVEMAFRDAKADVIIMSNYTDREIAHCVIQLFTNTTGVTR